MFLGLDIHKREAQVAVRDDDGTLIEETRVDKTELEALAERYAGGEAVLEATTNYYHIYDALSKHLDVVVCHPPKLKAIAESDKKTDRIDAKELSRLLWLDSVHESYVPTGVIRECRVLVRDRNKLVQERTMFANKIHALLADHGITRRWTPLSKAGRDFLSDFRYRSPGTACCRRTCQ